MNNRFEHTNMNEVDEAVTVLIDYTMIMLRGLKLSLIITKP